MSRRARLVQIGSAAAFLAIAAVLVLIVISQTANDGGDTELEGVAEVRRELRGIHQDALVLGDPGAPVTLREFGDLRCPVCAAFAESELPDVIASAVRTGRARIEFANLPILGEESEVAARAAVAAGYQGRGWSFVAIFYANQGLESDEYVDDEFLTAIARAAGVADIGRWNRERRGAGPAWAVADSERRAEALGFSSTPSFAVSGPGTDGFEPVEGQASAASLEAAIDAASD